MDDEIFYDFQLNYVYLTRKCPMVKLL